MTDHRAPVDEVRGVSRPFTGLPILVINMHIVSSGLGLRCPGSIAVYWRTPRQRGSLPPTTSDIALSARSAVVQARRLMPLRPVTIQEAERLAEAQAVLLLAELGVEHPPVSTRVLSSLPRVEVKRCRNLPLSAFAQWDQTHWLIGLNSSEPVTRQRFSLGHELKHILDAPLEFTIYERLSKRDRERIADRFAASLLMPSRWMRQALRAQPTLDIRGLARRFAVSPLAVRVRL